MEKRSLSKIKTIAKIMNNLDKTRHTVLSDRIEKIINAFTKDNMDISYLSDVQPENTENITDDDIEDPISPKDIDHLLDKLESVIDAMGDDFDPDLIPVSKKILKELLEKFDSIHNSNEIQEQQYIEPPNTPSIANFTNSLIKLSQIADRLEDLGESESVQQIDQMLLETIKQEPMVTITQHAIDRAAQRAGLPKKIIAKTAIKDVVKYIEKHGIPTDVQVGELYVPRDPNYGWVVRQHPQHLERFTVITLTPSAMKGIE